MMKTVKLRKKLWEKLMIEISLRIKKFNANKSSSVKTEIKTYHNDFKCELNPFKNHYS